MALMFGATRAARQAVTPRSALVAATLARSRSGVPFGLRACSSQSATATVQAEAPPAASAASEEEKTAESEEERGMRPTEIVAHLDRYIIGQADAKRAVAVALRNRWRRQRVISPLREEITPKNILMIGPTGVGKTEIARRLAKLANAPFIKVEATKFTEVRNQNKITHSGY